MSRKIEKLELTSAKAIALEIAAVGLIAWRYRTAILRKDDEPSEPERPPTPLSHPTDEGTVYVITDGSNENVQVGMKFNEGNFVAISTSNEDGSPDGERVSMKADQEGLISLLQNIRKVRRSWAHRKKV